MTITNTKKNAGPITPGIQDKTVLRQEGRFVLVAIGTHVAQWFKLVVKKETVNG